MTEPTPMRLLVVGLDWPAEPFVVQLLQGLRHRGMHLSSATSQRPTEEAVDAWVPVPGGDGLPTRAIATLATRSPPGLARAARQRSRPGGTPRWRQVLRLEAVRAAHADVIYLPWTATAVGLPEIFDLKVPVIVSCRGAQVNVAPWNPERPEVREGLPHVFERAAAVHCVSDAIRDEAVGHGLDPRRATVIRPAVDLDRFHPAPARAGHGQIRLITVGSVIWRKGIEYALLAVRRLLDEGLDVRYEIVGAERDGGATRHAIHDLDLVEHVHLVGRVDHGQIPSRITGADVLLSTSVSEGIANVVLETMAVGRPVVVTDCGGMSEVVDDGTEGRVVPVRDAPAIAAAVRSLVDPDVRAAMGRAGRARVESEHDLREQIAMFAALAESTGWGRP